MRWKRCSREAAAVLALAVLAQAALVVADPVGTLAAPAPSGLPALPGLAPGGGPGSGRVMVDGDRAPWNALGRVQTELGARCTGFLVAPAVVATAAHCLFLPEVDRFILPRDVHFLLGADRGGYAAHARAVSFRIPPGYDPHRELATASLDRAFLVLDHPVAPAGTAIPIAPVLPPAGTMLVLGGYDQDMAERLLVDPHCRLLGAADGVIRHDCAGTRGTSGAPLLAARAGGGFDAVGVQVAGQLAVRGGLAAVLTR